MTSADPAPIFDGTISYQALQVISAARQWAAEIWTTNETEPVEFMDELPRVTLGTDEERARRVLLDAVHDLEHLDRRERPHPSSFPFDYPA